jgi:ABC-type Fe3+ transport system permease subunit
VGSGALHTTLIESGSVAPAAAYSWIFALEAAAVTVAGGVLYHISVRKFRDSHASGISREDLARAMEAGSTA